MERHVYCLLETLHDDLTHPAKKKKTVWLFLPISPRLSSLHDTYVVLVSASPPPTKHPAGLRHPWRKTSSDIIESNYVLCYVIIAPLQPQLLQCHKHNTNYLLFHIFWSPRFISEDIFPRSSCNQEVMPVDRKITPSP